MIYSVVITSYPHTPYKKRKNHRRTPNYENRKPNLSLTKLIFYDFFFFFFFWGGKLIFYDGMRKLSVSYLNVLFLGNISYSWLFHTGCRFKTIRKDERWQNIQTCLNIFGSPQLQTRRLDIIGAGNPPPLGINTRSLFLFYHTV